MYDLIILGGGPGGYVSAIIGAKKGLKVLLVEKDRVGGVCLNRGCIPTKTMIHYAKLLEKVNSSIKSNIFGDLRYLRNSIIHHRGIALREVEKCKIFSWYKQNDEIFIDGDQMEEIVSTIKESNLDIYSIEERGQERGPRKGS